MTHIETIKQINEDLVNSVLKIMDNSEYHMVEFKRPFKAYLEQVVDYNGESILVPLSVRYLYRDGTIGTEEDNYSIRDLSMHEIAYMLDALEAGEFTVDDDEFIDPAGGRGLQSHI